MPRDSVPGGGPPSRALIRPFTSATTSAACVSARASETRRSAHRSADLLELDRQDPESDVANDAGGSPVFRDKNGCKEIGGIKADSALVRGIRELGGKSQTKRRTRIGLADDSHLVAMTRSSTLDVESPVAVTISDNGAGSRDVMLRWLYNPPSIWISAIELRPMLTPIREAQEVSFQA